MGKAKQARELVPLTVYLPPPVLAALEAQAAAEYATVSAVARRLLAAAVERQERLGR